MSIRHRVDVARDYGLYDDDTNNHRILAANRDQAVEHALNALHEAATDTANGKEVLIVAGSATVYRAALARGFAAYVVRPILEETDRQREARLTNAVVPHCLCSFRNLLAGPNACTHHNFIDPVILLCDVLAYLDPAEVGAVVAQYGSGKVFATQMFEGGGCGAWDPTGTRECIQVCTEDTLTAYVAGNNGPYVAPRLSHLYPPGNRHRVSFSMKVRVGLVMVLSLGTCDESPAGFTGEPISTQSRYEIVKHDSDGFIFLSRIKLAEIMYTLECPPTLKIDHASRNERVVRQKCAALLAQAVASPFTALGLTTDFNSGLVMSCELDGALGTLANFVLTRYHARVSLFARCQLLAKELRTRAGLFGVSPPLTLMASGALLWGLQNASSHANAFFATQALNATMGVKTGLGILRVAAAEQAKQLGGVAVALGDVAIDALTDKIVKTKAAFVSQIFQQSTFGALTMSQHVGNLPPLLPIPFWGTIMLDYDAALIKAAGIPTRRFVITLPFQIDEASYAVYESAVKRVFARAFGVGEECEAVDMWKFTCEGVVGPGTVSCVPHPLLMSANDTDRQALAIQTAYRNIPVAMAPFVEEYYPKIGLLISISHLVIAGPAHNPSPFHWAEWFARVAMEYSDATRGTNTYWWRVGLHYLRNWSSLIGMMIGPMLQLSGRYVNTWYLELIAADGVQIVSDGPAEGCVDIGPINLKVYEAVQAVKPTAGALTLGIGPNLVDSSVRPPSGWSISAPKGLVAKLLIAGALVWAAPKVYAWGRKQLKKSIVKYDRLPAAEKRTNWFWERLGFSRPAQVGTVSEYHNRIIEDGCTYTTDETCIASSPGEFAPEWRRDLKLVERAGWTVSVYEQFNGLFKRDRPVSPGRLGLTVLQYANGMTPRNAAGNNVHDYVQMAIGRILDINQREERSMRLDFAIDFILDQFLDKCDAKGMDQFIVPELGSEAFDALADEFIEHFPVKRISDKWAHLLEEWRASEFDTRNMGPGVYSVFLKLESWWKLAAKGPGMFGQYVAHKPRCIWVPEERRVLVSAIAVYGVAKHFKLITKRDGGYDDFNIVYTSSMTGEQVGALVQRFRNSAFDPNNSWTWFLLLVNGDDNWMTYHPGFIERHGALPVECLTGWSSRMREIGRNTEPQLSPFFASSYSSSRFMPCVDPEGNETFVLAPCFARTACKLGTTLSALPQSRVLGGGVPSTEGFLMWLRRVYDVTNDLCSKLTHDPLALRLFGAIREHVVSLLGSRLEGPALRVGEREIMAEEYQFGLTGVMAPHPDLFVVSTERWFGMPYSEIVQGVDEIVAAWTSVAWDEKERVLTTGMVGLQGCKLFMRGLGNHGPGVPGYRPDSFIEPLAGEKLSKGIAEVPRRLLVPGGITGVPEERSLALDHFALFLVRRKRVIVLSARKADENGGELARALTKFDPNVRVFIPGRGAGSLGRDASGVWRGRRVARSYAEDLTVPVLVVGEAIDEWEAQDDQDTLFLFPGERLLSIAGPLPICPDTEIQDGEYCICGTMDTFRVEGSSRLHASVCSGYDRLDHIRTLGFMCAAGLPAIINPNSAKWHVPIEGLFTARETAAWDFWAMESDAAAFDNSTTEVSIRALVRLLDGIAQWDGRARWLLESLTKGAHFVSRAVGGKTRWCWPSGIPLTSFGGSLMNAMEFIECLRQSLESVGIDMPSGPAGGGTAADGTPTHA